MIHGARLTFDGHVLRSFSLGSKRGDDGSFKRQVSSFRGSSPTTSSDFPVQSGRYHLYVARACPWAHRTLIGRELMGLQDAISVSFVDPIRDERGWRFSGGGYVDPVNGFRLSQRGLPAVRAGL